MEKEKPNNESKEKPDHSPETNTATVSQNEQMPDPCLQELVFLYAGRLQGATSDGDTIALCDKLVNTVERVFDLFVDSSNEQISAAQAKADAAFGFEGELRQAIEEQGLEIERLKKYETGVREITHELEDKENENLELKNKLGQAENEIKKLELKQKNGKK